MASQSAVTTVIPLRLENELVARLEALAAGKARNTVAKTALRLGLGLLEAQRGSASVVKKRGLTPAKPAKAAKAGPSARCLDAEKTPSTPAKAARVAKADAPFDLVHFAAQVLGAAALVPKRQRFGEDRVFISHVWRELLLSYSGVLGLDTFKVRLVEANRARLLSLVCADMAPMLNQVDVEESLTRYLGAEFHFVCV